MIRGTHPLYFPSGTIKTDLPSWSFWTYCLNASEAWLFVAILKAYGNPYNKKTKIITLRYKTMVFLFAELFFVIKNELTIHHKHVAYNIILPVLLLSHLLKKLAYIEKCKL